MNRKAETHHEKLQFYGQELWIKMGICTS